MLFDNLEALPMQPSPYTPGSVAPEVPGRDRQLAEIRERLDYMTVLGRLVPRIRVDHAPRGVGKTSLLRQIQRDAEAKGAATLWVIAGQSYGLVPAIASATQRMARTWTSTLATRVATTLDHLEVKVGAGIPGVAGIEASWRRGDDRAPSPAVDVTREFEDVLVAATAAARENGHTGLVLLIDEVQAADPASLQTLSYAWQNFQSEQPDLSAAVFAAGLPESVKHINAAVSNSERFAYRRLDDLTDDAAAVALAMPATRLGVHWNDNAVAEGVRAAGGYPHLLQLIGDNSWRRAGLPDPGGLITVEHVQAAWTDVHADVRELYDARLSKVDEGADLEFIKAMASLGDGPVQRAAVAAVLEKSSTAISRSREHLLSDGIITEAGYARMQFAVPGFAAHVREVFDIEPSPSPQLQAAAGDSVTSAVANARQAVAELQNGRANPAPDREVDHEATRATENHSQPRRSDPGPQGPRLS